jgi:methyl-accepting chemotaxis protein
MAKSKPSPAATTPANAPEAPSADLTAGRADAPAPKGGKGAAAKSAAESKTGSTGANMVIDTERTSSDQTRKRGSQRGSEDSQDPGYINEQLNRVLFALDAFKKGDVSVRLTKQNDDIFAEIAEAYNSMVFLARHD